jgi:signal transduction histidine kinase
VQEPSPEQYNPPLGRWAQTWRLLLCLAISGLVWSQVAPAEAREKPWLFWVDLGVGLAAFGLVQFRRRWPLAVALVLSSVQVVSGFSSGPGILAVVSLATRRRLPQILLVGVVGVVGGQLYNYVVPQPSDDPPWVDVTVVVLTAVAMSIFGMYVGSRRELLWSLRDRAEQAERQQELRVAQARARERERIAREMHDVLAHRISLVTMHAGALAYRTDLPPEQVRETAQLISAKAHEALVDLREVLGTLRQSEPTRPQPTLAELPELIEEASHGGMHVIFDSTVQDPSAVPERIGRTVYRLVQEALTNARKHAPGSAVAVAVDGTVGTGLTVAVHNARANGGIDGRVAGTNGAAPPGSGLGLVGMRERVELAGGRLEVRGDSRTFALEGWLPWPT